MHFFLTEKCLPWVMLPYSNHPYWNQQSCRFPASDVLQQVSISSINNIIKLFLRPLLPYLTAFALIRVCDGLCFPQWGMNSTTEGLVLSKNSPLYCCLTKSPFFFVCVCVEGGWDPQITFNIDSYLILIYWAVFDVFKLSCLSAIISFSGMWSVGVGWD